MTAPVSQRILIVDDQPANLQVLGTTLGRLGYEIVPASDGPTALKRLALRPPDLVMLDLFMPGMDGFEVCRRIREQPDHLETPVIFLSAADEKNLIVRALECGGVDYITKPFHQAELILRVQTQLSLKAARDRLKRLAEDKEELLGILAHDLKNHLGAIQMTSQLLNERVSSTDGSLRRIASTLTTASGQTLSFLREYLANAARDHGSTVELVPVDLNSVVTQAIEAYATAALHKEQRFDVHLDPAHVQVVADPGALRQIVDNLLSNAVKFSPAGKVIHVHTRVAGPVAELEVRDEGPGFTPADRERLFRRYTRLSARPTGGEPSTGLGLSIVQKLAQAMNASITCRSTPGEGATFLLKLRGNPLAP